MKTPEQRINNIIGQLEGVKRMLSDRDSDCCSLLIQLKAIKSALSSLMEKMISEELDHCLASRQPAKQEKVERMIKEIINN